MDESSLMEHVIKPIIEICGLPADHCNAVFGWIGDREDGVVHTIDITRAGINPWAEYPGAGLRPVAETVELFDGPVLHWGGEAEKSRRRGVVRTEQRDTDRYMGL